jgi:ribonuclease-3
MKTFTAQVRVGEQRYGNGVGRSKKEAEQAAAETAYGELAETLGVADPVAKGVADEVADALADAVTDLTEPAGD